MPNVLTEILQWCTIPEDQNVLNWVLPAVVLSQVCHHWFHVALSTPVIWSLLSFTTVDSFQLHHWHILPIYFQLCSQRIPFSLTIKEWENDLMRPSQPILSKAPRITLLSTNAMQVISSVCCAFPSLLFLRVHLREDGDAYYRLLLMLRYAPLLEQLDIQVGNLNYDPIGCNPPIILGKLTSLRFTISWFYDIPTLFLILQVPLITSLFLSAPGSPPTLAFWSAVSAFLEAYPTLIKLDLNDIAFPEQELDNTNKLGHFLEAMIHIRHLTLHLMPLGLFFQRISKQATPVLCSKLEHLRVSFSRIPDDAFMEFVSSRASLDVQHMGSLNRLKSFHLDRCWGLTLLSIGSLSGLKQHSGVEISITNVIDSWQSKLLELDDFSRN
ncbi:hypothetical protein M422DRAFT_266007 [Sphaerobolus stellatus SS14]|uniref:F-box domain-containing protein n=1 Tax=Sphaerobolus stellatus (strain SS14) TaxID=990650 RepID=A0A0C9TQ19_SPHS4|nr:hypothetical protein M422DRAFT_266007 [Sphaerobolus stellatus SS14]